MKKEMFDRLKELVETASLLNPSLIDEEAFKKEVCEILGIKINSSPIFHNESEFEKWMERMRDIKLPDYKPMEIYYESKTNGVNENNYESKTNGVDEMIHVTTC